MTPDTAHTPTPWKVVENEVGWLAQIAEQNWPAKGKGIGFCEGLMPEAEANAAFIVRAVNCHQEMVDTLKLISEGLSKELLDYTNQQALRGLISTVLRKAEEK